MKSVCVITGVGGLVGSQCAEYFSKYFDLIVGIDNDSRARFFGGAASVGWNIERLRRVLKDKFHFYRESIGSCTMYGLLHSTSSNRGDIQLIIHAAAQPSHDWAADHPVEDFEVNAYGTLNLLEAFRRHCPKAVFIFTSTNKVYGDNPNKLGFTELPSRYTPAPWELGTVERGIDETMSVDLCIHSLFGVSKLAADMMVQEYGRNFGLKTGVFRCGCLSGPLHSGAKQHGFLSYLVKCAVEGIPTRPGSFCSTPYTIIGYKGKQVRDNLHSLDLARAFHAFYQDPRPGEVYNMGGGLLSNCSVIEAIAYIEACLGSKMNVKYNPVARTGDHQWYISCLEKFQAHYPQWGVTMNWQWIVEEILRAKGVVPR